jgi:hypothetical protein
VYSWEATAKAVVGFIEAQEVDAAVLEELVAVRRQRAEQRVKALSALDLILAGCVRATAALPDLLSYVALALAGFSQHPTADQPGKHNKSNDNNNNKKKKGNNASSSSTALLHYSHDLAVPPSLRI